MVDPVKALKAYNRTTEVLEGLTADNERLRRLVQALEEENARLCSDLESRKAGWWTGSKTDITGADLTGTVGL